MKDKYYEQAVTCVKDRVLPVQMELYRSCSGDLDRVYGEALSHLPRKIAPFESTTFVVCSVLTDRELWRKEGNHDHRKENNAHRFHIRFADTDVWLLCKVRPDKSGH